MLKNSGSIASGRSLRTLLFGASVLGVLAISGVASAQQQRDPAYSAARAAGQVGEKADGYLGFPVSPSAEIRRMADDINIKRRAIYAEKAAEQHATVEQYAFTTACLLIGKTAVGEKYQGPDGIWHTRGTGPALRDSRCP